VPHRNYKAHLPLSSFVPYFSPLLLDVIYHFDTSDQRKLQGYIFRIYPLPMQADSLLSWGRLIDSLLTSHPQPTVTERFTVYIVPFVTFNWGFQILIFDERFTDHFTLFVHNDTCITRIQTLHLC